MLMFKVNQGVQLLDNVAEVMSQQGFMAGMSWMFQTVTPGKKLDLIKRT